MRGEELAQSLTASPSTPLPPSTLPTAGTTTPNSTPTLTLGQAAFDFTAEIAARQVHLERYLADLSAATAEKQKERERAKEERQERGKSISGQKAQDQVDDSAESDGEESEHAASNHSRSNSEAGSDSGASDVTNRSRSRSSLASLDSVGTCSSRGSSSGRSSTSDGPAITPQRPALALSRYSEVAGVGGVAGGGVWCEGDEGGDAEEGFDHYYIGDGEESEEEGAYGGLGGCGLGSGLDSELDLGLGLGLGLGIGLEEFPLPAAHLPHIHVTSH